MKTRHHLICFVIYYLGAWKPDEADLRPRSHLIQTTCHGHQAEHRFLLIFPLGPCRPCHQNGDKENKCCIGHCNLVPRVSLPGDGKKRDPGNEVVVVVPPAPTPRLLHSGCFQDGGTLVSRLPTRLAHSETLFPVAFLCFKGSQSQLQI